MAVQPVKQRKLMCAGCKGNKPPAQTKLHGQYLHFESSITSFQVTVVCGNCTPKGSAAHLQTRRISLLDPAALLVPGEPWNGRLRVLGNDEPQDPVGGRSYLAMCTRCELVFVSCGHCQHASQACPDLQNHVQLGLITRNPPVPFICNNSLYWPFLERVKATMKERIELKRQGDPDYRIQDHVQASLDEIMRLLHTFAAISFNLKCNVGLTAVAIFRVLLEPENRRMITITTKIDNHDDDDVDPDINIIRDHFLKFGQFTGEPILIRSARPRADDPLTAVHELEYEHRESAEAAVMRAAIAPDVNLGGDTRLAEVMLGHN